jgi:hypothetical protein
MPYTAIREVDFVNGDVSNLTVNSYDQALNLAKGFINGDHLKCVVLQKLGGGNYKVWFKNIRGTNPAGRNSSLEDFVTIVYGENI